MDDIDFKPSEIYLGGPPLVATMGRSELEHAAAIIVRTCQATGDVWRAVTWAEARLVIEADVAEKRTPFDAIWTNPFVRPDAHGLVAKGFASKDGDAVALTAQGLEAIRRWVQRAPAPEIRP